MHAGLTKSTTLPKPITQVYSKPLNGHKVMHGTDTVRVLSLPVNSISFTSALHEVWQAGKQRKTGYACFANVHMLVEAHQDKAFQRVMDTAKWVFADGQPVAKSCQLLAHKDQERIAGMDFFPEFLDYVDGRGGGKVAIYGGDAETLSIVKQKIENQYTSVELVAAICPPFRTLTPEEEAKDIQTLNESGAEWIIVTLGCPKQEKWMYKHHQSLNAVLLGLGGAIPIFAGNVKRAPFWMQQMSLEWMYRLMQEPKRLFKRYLVTNSVFMYLLSAALLKKWTQLHERKSFEPVRQRS